MPRGAKVIKRPAAKPHRVRPVRPASHSGRRKSKKAAAAAAAEAAHAAAAAAEAALAEKVSELTKALGIVAAENEELKQQVIHERERAAAYKLELGRARARWRAWAG
jgi:molecular chaperone GrpE (heat shock protein)